MQFDLVVQKLERKYTKLVLKTEQIYLCFKINFFYLKFILNIYKF